MQQDRISGAAEIERKAIKFIEKYIDKPSLFKKSVELLSTYPSMASIWNIVNFAFLYGKRAREKYDEMANANKKVIENGAKFIRDNQTILTYSRSSTVARILKKCKAKNIKIICSESRPRYEGRRLAKELSRMFPVTITTDAALSYFLDDADFVLIGADAVLERHVINKVGTFPLAMVAKEKKKPLYVAASSYKLFPFALIKEETGEEIWKNSPENVIVKNFYFDVTPRKFIKAYIMEEGIISKPSFKHEIAEEIEKIRDILNERFYLVR
ncbi:MAG: hypothetical protein J7L58_01055 [Thermoplasmata archaeon]|nr:hypothetical protein [Thermoplasmata archaeon]